MFPNEELPDIDPVCRLLQSPDPQDTADPGDYEFWWTGKKLIPENNISIYTGRNEKTKLQIKLQKKGSGAPVRDPQLDEEGQKKLIAYYYKKQEEEKRLAASAYRDQEIYLASERNVSLKQVLHGLGNQVTYKPR